MQKHINTYKMTNILIF